MHSQKLNKGNCFDISLNIHPAPLSDSLYCLSKSTLTFALRRKILKNNKKEGVFDTINRFQAVLCTVNWCESSGF